MSVSDQEAWQQKEFDDLKTENKELREELRWLQRMHVAKCSSEDKMCRDSLALAKKIDKEIMSLYSNSCTHAMRDPEGARCLRCGKDLDESYVNALEAKLLELADTTPHEWLKREIKELLESNI